MTDDHTLTECQSAAGKDGHVFQCFAVGAVCQCGAMHVVKTGEDDTPLGTVGWATITPRSPRDQHASAVPPQKASE